MARRPAARAQVERAVADGGCSFRYHSHGFSLPCPVVEGALVRRRVLLSVVCLAAAVATTSLAQQGPADEASSGRRITGPYAALAYRFIGPPGNRRARWPAFPVTSTPTTPAAQAAACGRASTAASTGDPCSTISRHSRSGRSPSRRAIPTSCGWGQVRRSSAATCRSATASTSRPTPARPGRTWASISPGASGGSSCTRGIPTSCSRRRSGTATDRSRSGASTAAMTAARRGRARCSSMPTPGRPTSPSIR